MDHLNTETQGAVLLSLKVSFCTVRCYEEEIKARKPFLAILPGCKAKELGSSRRKVTAWQHDRSHYSKCFLSFIFLLLSSQGKELFTATVTERHSNGWCVEKAASHV